MLTLAVTTRLVSRPHGAHSSPSSALPHSLHLILDVLHGNQHSFVPEGHTALLLGLRGQVASFEADLDSTWCQRAPISGRGRSLGVLSKTASCLIVGQVGLSGVRLWAKGQTQPWLSQGSASSLEEMSSQILHCLNWHHSPSTRGTLYTFSLEDGSQLLQPSIGYSEGYSEASLALLCLSFETLGKSFSLSKPQFLHL